MVTKLKRLYMCCPWPVTSKRSVFLFGIFLKLIWDIQPTLPTLQQAQTAALLTLLNLNSQDDSSATAVSLGKSQGLGIPNAAPPVWKILVLDQHTKDVLATVLRVQDLRDVGVTLHV